MADQKLTIAGREFGSRLLTGTGKYDSFETMREALAASEKELVEQTRMRTALSRYLSADVVELIAREPDRLRLGGVTTIRVLDIGGGLGIRYSHERSIEPAEFAGAVLPLLTPTGLTVYLEPGRFLVGSAGLERSTSSDEAKL
mgnify:CR=1 FL=1